MLIMLGRLEGCFAIACENDLDGRGEDNWREGLMGHHRVVFRCLKACIVAQVLWWQVRMGAGSAADFQSGSYEEVMRLLSLMLPSVKLLLLLLGQTRIF